MSISLTVSHRGSSYPLLFESTATLSDLRRRLEELTSVSPALQKLLYKGKSTRGVSDDETLLDAGFKDGMKVQMLGSTSQELGGLKAAEDEQTRRNRIMKERALKPAVKLRSTGAASVTSTTYIFHRLTPLEHLPSPESALSLLKRLSDDPAIRHVMQKHKFAVGVLTELAPHEHPELLGLNVNAGEAIKLRLRTNAYDGFRLYSDVRKVLCHELAHNVHGDHDNNFKALNSQLNREVVEFERSAREGTNHLYSGEIYEPDDAESALRAEAYVLGGTNSASSNDTQEERRRRILEATVSRLRKEEEELEHSCGTAT